MAVTKGSQKQLITFAFRQKSGVHAIWEIISQTLMKQVLFWGVLALNKDLSLGKHCLWALPQYCLRLPASEAWSSHEALGCPTPPGHAGKAGGAPSVVLCRQTTENSWLWKGTQNLSHRSPGVGNDETEENEKSLMEGCAGISWVTSTGPHWGLSVGHFPFFSSKQGTENPIAFPITYKITQGNWHSWV